MKDFLTPVDFIARWGQAGSPWPLEESLAYTRWLSRVHYENFTVVSWLLPKRLHQDFYNVYAFCRWADDLGDEFKDANQSLDLLAWWRSGVDRMYRGETAHPVFVALTSTVKRHSLPAEPFHDLIRAFEQDQTVRRYETFSGLLDYCRYSANPVGRLVLHLCGYTDEKRRALSDATCTALQLANFWQDVPRDWAIGRVYLPLELMEKHRYSPEALETDLRRRWASGACKALMRDLVGRAQQLFDEGLPLANQLDWRLAFDITLFSRGGMAILEKIRRQGYDVFSHRPVLTKLDRFRIAARALISPRPGSRSDAPGTRHAYR